MTLLFLTAIASGFLGGVAITRAMHETPHDLDAPTGTRLIENGDML